MISRFLAALGCLLLLSGRRRAQAQAPTPAARLVEKITASPGQVVIPYEKYVLPNGLTLLVSEDHSDPLVRVELTFHVGSAREQPGHSGFAHLFEHVRLFQGSAHGAPGSGHPLLAAAGGDDINGTTSRDKTSYYETLPMNQLETGLRLGAEQMGFSLGVATPQGFAREQDNVKNERLENKDNAPYGRADEVLTARYPSVAMAALARLGSRVTFAGGRNETTVTVQTLTRHLDATLALVLESLLHPRLAPEHFARAQQQLTRVRDDTADPESMAYDVLQRQLYGPGRIDGWPVEGTAATVGSLTLADVRHFYRTYYAPNLAALAIVSDAPEATLVPQLAGLLAWTTPAVAPPRAMPAPVAGPGRLYFVATPGAPQSILRLGYATRPYDATGPFYHAYLMQYPLGWARGSRIYRNLRERHGYTYSAWANFYATPYGGTYTAASAVRADATAPALRELLQEITHYRATGITPEELAATKTTLSQKQALQFETGPQKVTFLTRPLTYDLPATYLQQQAAVLATLTKPEVDALAQHYLPVEQFSIVVIGDKRHLPALRQLGYPVVLLDASGQPLPRARPRLTKTIRASALKNPAAKGH